MYKICLVEDEPNLAKLIKTYLEKASYEVVTFYKGQDALNYIENKFDPWYCLPESSNKSFLPFLQLRHNVL